jgi:hypothetical protein
MEITGDQVSIDEEDINFTAEDSTNVEYSIAYWDTAGTKITVSQTIMVTWMPSKAVGSGSLPFTHSLAASSENCTLSGIQWCWGVD